jgi:hypothetical protein
LPLYFAIYFNLVCLLKSGKNTTKINHLIKLSKILFGAIVLEKEKLHSKPGARYFNPMVDLSFYLAL